MQHPAATPGAASVAALLARLNPGDHGLVFGPRTFAPPLVDALVERAVALGFRLVVAHRAESEAALRAVVRRSAAGSMALDAGGLAPLGADGLAMLYRAAAQRGPRAFDDLVRDAEAAGFRGVLACILAGEGMRELAEAEAALTPRPGPRLALQCIYPAPPAGTGDALRLLRAHTPGRMVMPAVWRLAETGGRADGPSDPASPPPRSRADPVPA